MNFRFNLNLKENLSKIKFLRNFLSVKGKKEN